MKIICRTDLPDLEIKRAGVVHRRRNMRMRRMQDLLWIAIVLGLAAATLAYARACERA